MELRSCATPAAHNGDISASLALNGASPADRLPGDVLDVDPFEAEIRGGKVL